MTGREVADILLSHPDDEVVLHTDSQSGLGFYEVAGIDYCVVAQKSDSSKVCLAIFPSDMQ